MTLRSPSNSVGGAHAKPWKYSLLRVPLAGLCYLTLGSAALAETDRWANCRNGISDARIIACTQLLQRAKHGTKHNQIAALLGRAAAYLVKGEPDHAIVDYGRILRHDPRSVAAYRGRAQAYCGKRDLGKSLADFTAALKIDPKSTQLRIDRGEAYVANADFDRAIVDFTEAIERSFPVSANAYDERGQAFLGKHDFDKAIADFSKAIEVDPRFSKALIDRSGAHRLKGDLRRAKEDIEAALSIDPNFPSAQEALKEITRLMAKSVIPAPPTSLANALAPEDHVTSDRLIVVAMGVTFIAFIGGAFRLRTRKSERAANEVYQETNFLVKGDQAAEIIVARQCGSAQLSFRRDEREPHSNEVFTNDIQKSADLSRDEVDVVEILPKEPRECGITADYFRTLVKSHEMEEDRQRADRRCAALEASKQRIRQLTERSLKDSDWREILHKAQTSAAQGAKEFMLIRFPSRLCSDAGRAINAPDPNWPETLRGEPADIFNRWLNELKPNGFQLAAQIIDFPEGTPGDAALFLIWGARTSRTAH